MLLGRNFKNFFCLVFIFLLVPNVWGNNTSFQNCKGSLSDTWNQGRIELIVPVNTWHNRSHYSKDRIKNYNEHPWGGGLAKTYIDEKDNRHRLLALSFQDSFNNPEPTLGYSWQAVWRAEKIFRPTLGVIAGFTMRKDYNWIPIPAAIPTLGLDIGPFSVETTYVVGFDILFTWVTFRF